MSKKTELQQGLIGFSSDGPYPQIVKHYPNFFEPNEHGEVLLYGTNQENKTHRSVYISKLGETKKINSNDDENPYLFTQGGYELRFNERSRNYVYTVYPKFEIDFDFIEQHSDTDRLSLLSHVRMMSPKIDILNNLDGQIPLTLSLKIGTNEACLFEVDSKKGACPRNLSNVTVDFRESDDRVEIIGTHTNLVKTKFINDIRKYKFHVSADLAYPSPDLNGILNEYTKFAEQDAPRRKDLMDIAKMKVFMEEVDPFKKF